MEQTKMPALEDFLNHYSQTCPECETRSNFYYLPSQWELELLNGIYKKCFICGHMIFAPFPEHKINVVVQEYLKILKCTHPELAKS